MAKQLIQIIIGMGQVVGKAFSRAVQREILESQNAARARATASSSGAQGDDHKSAATNALTGITVQEAKQILNIQDIHDKEKLMQNYEHLFNQNDKSKGGSLYLQSKIVRAKERIDQELESTAQKESNDPSDKT